MKNLTVDRRGGELTEEQQKEPWGIFNWGGDPSFEAGADLVESFKTRSAARDALKVMLNPEPEEGPVHPEGQPAPGTSAWPLKDEPKVSTRRVVTPVPTKKLELIAYIVQLCAALGRSAARYVKGNHTTWDEEYTEVMNLRARCRELEIEVPAYDAKNYPAIS